MCCRALRSLWLFFFNDTATTEIYTLSLHDALPIFVGHGAALREGHAEGGALGGDPASADAEHDAPAGERVERSDHLGGDDRVAIRDDEHSGAEPDPAGRPGDDGERHEGGEDRLAEIDDVGVRHHDVIADPDRVVAELLGPDRRAPDEVPC